LHRARLSDGLAQSGARATTPFLHLYRHDPAPIADSLPAAAGIVTRGSAAADSAAIKSEEARREAPARLTAEREGILRSALDDLPALGARLRARYTHPAATRWPAKLWATEVKRRVDEDRVDEEEELGSDLIVKADTLTSPPAKNAQLNADAAERGTRLHEVLEALDFTSLGDVLGGPPAERERAVLATARELSRRGRLPVEWMTRENLVPVIEFLADPLAIAMRRAGASLEREAVFSLRMRPSELARIWPAAAELDEDEWVLIQGKIDAIWRDGERVIVLDFKSDRVAAPDEIRARTDFYRPQMEIYRRAAARLWSAQQVECLLYFLEPRQAVRVE
jgi:ATP-dependent helicase/nuclease subunit A